MPTINGQKDVSAVARCGLLLCGNCRSKAEDVAWSRVQDHYNAYRAEVLDEINRLESTKAKGKQRASAEEMQEWEINESDLPAHFRGDSNIGLARRIVASSGLNTDSRLKERLQELEFSVRICTRRLLLRLTYLNPTDGPCTHSH